MSQSSIAHRISRLLAWRGFPFLVIGLALLACFQVLGLDTAADDWLHQLYGAPTAQLEGLKPRPWNIFVFADGDPASNRALIDAGVFPWWTDPQAKLSFFRPLAVFFARIDGWLWADHPVMMHLHSLLWFGLAIYALSQCYRRWIGDSIVHCGPAIAGLALWIFALDDARGPTVGWLANRNALIALALGASTLWLHARSLQSDAKGGDKAVALALWGLALLAGESALGYLGYLLAHAIWLQKGTKISRALTFSPYLALALAYVTLRNALGYGSFSSDFYLNPLTNLEGFVSQAWQRIPILLASSLAGIWSDIPAGIGTAYPGAMLYLIPACLFAVGLVIYFGWPAWRNEPVAKVFAVGTLASTILCAGTFPADRILCPVSLGSSGLLALSIWRGLQSAQGLWGRKGAAWALILVHVVISPAFLPARSLSMEYATRPVMRVHQSLPADDALEDHTLILINPPSDPQASYFMIYRVAKGLARPKHFRWLFAGATPLAITRLDARTLRIVPTEGFLPGMSERMLRSVDRPFAVGDEIELQGLRITIEALTDDGRPAKARYHFDRPLEDPHFLWARWDGKGFVPYQPPRVGAPDHLTGHDLLRSFDPLPALAPSRTVQDWQQEARESYHRGI